MKMIPFEPGHLKEIIPQPAQASEVLFEGPKIDVPEGPAITGVVDGKVILCFGKSTQWKGRHILWALLSQDANKHMVSVFRAMKTAVDMQTGEGRLEVIVRAGFQEGRRMARMLGFHMHHYEEKFLPDGADAIIFVRYM
jgi:hypothetical protein